MSNKKKKREKKGKPFFRCSNISKMQKSDVSAQKLFQINKANNDIGSFYIADGREGWHRKKTNRMEPEIYMINRCSPYM